VAAEKEDQNSMKGRGKKTQGEVQRVVRKERQGGAADNETAESVRWFKNVREGRTMKEEGLNVHRNQKGESRLRGSALDEKAGEGVLKMI